MSDLLVLADRCEAATGPDRGLDFQLDYARCNWPAIPPPPTGQEWSELEKAEDLPPTYTASLDAAMMLVPEGWEAALYWGVAGFKPEAQLENRGVQGAFAEPLSGHAATPALALCAAALRARSALKQSGDLS